MPSIQTERIYICGNPNCNANTVIVPLTPILSDNGRAFFYLCPTVTCECGVEAHPIKSVPE